MTEPTPRTQPTTPASTPPQELQSLVASQLPSPPSLFREFLAAVDWLIFGGWIEWLLEGRFEALSAKKNLSKTLWDPELVKEINQLKGTQNIEYYQNYFIKTLMSFSIEDLDMLESLLRFEKVRSYVANIMIKNTNELPKKLRSLIDFEDSDLIVKLTTQPSQPNPEKQ